MKKNKKKIIAIIAIVTMIRTISVIPMTSLSLGMRLIFSESFICLSPFLFYSLTKYYHKMEGQSIKIVRLKTIKFYPLQRSIVLFQKASTDFTKKYF